MEIIELQSLAIVDFAECTIKNRNWFFFEIDGVKYHLYFEEGAMKHHYTIESIVHKQPTCHFCTKERFQRGFCDMLFSKRKELFYLLLKQSKNRLKWLTCVIQ